MRTDMPCRVMEEDDDQKPGIEYSHREPIVTGWANSNRPSVSKMRTREEIEADKRQDLASATGLTRREPIDDQDWNDDIWHPPVGGY